ncbi:hypothetical protein SDC9_81458 [bioreactor metagenome]|uniref:Uncharacterized protein n=1 Tax=bioreactor metagenome TaxID=1076179 RepID=A0A644Z3L6_9ZZZZ
MSKLFSRFVNRQMLVDFFFVCFGFATRFSQVSSSLEANDTDSSFMVVLQYAGFGLSDHNYVVQFGKRSVIRTRSGHVDDTFLETNDFSGGDDGHSLEHVSAAFANHLNLAQHAGENIARTGNFYPRFNNIFHRDNSNRITRMNDVDVNGSNAFVSANSLNHFRLINIKRAVAQFGRFTKLNIFNVNITQF